MYLKEEVSNTIVISKSKFICYLKNVENENEYKEYLTLIRKKHYDADHVCSAFIIDDIKRSNDDKEPASSAGIPILNVLEKHHLNHICCLVVRYFGGIKLGVGGLIRAYSNSCLACLEIADLYELETYQKYSLSLDYSSSNKIDYLLRNNTIILNCEYQEEVTYTFAIKDLKILETIKEYLKGKSPTYIEEIKIEKSAKIKIC